jgi:hypothetical protein
LHSDCAEIEQRFRIDSAAIPQRFCSDSAAIPQRFRSDSAAILQRLRCDTFVIPQRIYIDITSISHGSDRAVESVQYCCASLSGIEKESLRNLQ